MRTHVTTLLDFMVAAQTLTAIYGSPDGPVDPERFYEQISSLLDDPKLLMAQGALGAAITNVPHVLLPEQRQPLRIVPSLS